MMEESVNEEHAYNSEDVTNTSLFHKKKKRNTSIYHTPSHDGGL